MNKGELKLFPIRFPSSSFSLIRQLIFGKSQVITRHPALIFPRTPGSLCSTVVRQLFDPCQTAVRRGSNTNYIPTSEKLHRTRPVFSRNLRKTKCRARENGTAAHRSGGGKGQSAANFTSTPLSAFAFFANV